MKLVVVVVVGVGGVGGVLLNNKKCQIIYQKTIFTFSHVLDE